jgi:hypothetical protein
MGFAASQARLLMLTARRSDLELQRQFLNQGRMQLSNILNLMFNNAASLEPQSANAQQLQNRIAAIQEIDKQLELQSKRIDTQHEACMTEIESVQKVIQRNIQMSFKSSG